MKREPLGVQAPPRWSATSEHLSAPLATLLSDAADPAARAPAPGTVAADPAPGAGGGVRLPPSEEERHASGRRPHSRRPAPAPSLSSCIPARGPRRHPVAAVAVDDELVWVAPQPTAACGAARRSSPAALIHLGLQLARERAAACGESILAPLDEAELIDAAAQVVASYLEDLPDLPLVGEPFGGEEGTD